MEALKDIWASLVSGVQERTTNPLSFAFLGSWCAWNFKFFVVLFGDGTASARLAAIEAMYPANLSTYLGGGLAFPLFTALAYVFLYPYFSAMAIRFYRGKQVEIANSVKGIEEKRLLSPTEVAARTRRHEAERRKWEEARTGFENQLQELRDALAESEKQIVAQKSDKPHSSSATSPSQVEAADVAVEQVSELEENGLGRAIHLGGSDEARLTKVMEKLVLYLSNVPSGASIQEVALNTNQNYTLVESELSKMRAFGLIEPGPRENWVLTDIGKKIALILLED